jgi:predicted DNA-binding transcriptional regulator YafY
VARGSGVKTTSKGKFDRLLKILSILNDGEQCNAGFLAEDLEVSERTVYRYMASLMSAGFPISYNPEKKTYAFEDGYSLRKTRLNPAEALALCLAGSLLKPLGGTFEKAIENLKTKIADNSRFEPVYLKIPQPDTPIDIFRLLKDLSSACIERRLVHIEYQSMSSHELTSRDIEPYFLFVSMGGFWNLYAYCRMRDDWRVFALDRIMSLVELDSYFVPQQVNDDLRSRAFAGFGTYLDGQPTDIVVRFSPTIRSFVDRAKWHPSQQNRSLPDGWLEVRFKTLGTEAVKYWLYQWIPHVRVVEPEELRKEMHKELKLQSKLLRPSGEGDTD